MAERSSVTTFIVGDRLPWSDDAPQPATAALDAAAVYDSGAIYDSGARHDCFISRISALGATVRVQVRKAPGDQVAVELGTGQRPAGTISWVKGGEAGVSFNQPVDLLALINRSLISQPAERRRMPRVELRCAVHIKAGGVFDRVMLRNISANGMQLEGDDLPPRGSMVSVFIDGLVVPAGEVVWRKDNLAGVQLFEELSWTSIVPWIREMMRKGVH